MVENPTYSELERKIKKLEKEAIEYLRKEREFNKERKLFDYGHLRVMSLQQKILKTPAGSNHLASRYIINRSAPWKFVTFWQPLF